MRATGIVRKVDELGRIVVPIELRRTMGIDIKDDVEIYSENEYIVLRKKKEACVFCGADEDLGEIKGKHVCRKCIKELADF